MRTSSHVRYSDTLFEDLSLTWRIAVSHITITGSTPNLSIILDAQ